MTQEEYDRYMAEQERLINEYNALVARKSHLIDEYNMLVEELTYAIEATVSVINQTNKVRNYIVPRLTESEAGVTVVNGMVKDVQREIEQLAEKYFLMKNISTASKKMMQLNNEYQQKFGLYNMLRRVTLGYVVGVDSNIISNESLRKTVEKNYLQNADYWISHCIMATMLWVSDEKEAAYRALNKALSIDRKKASLFFLLLNLRFGRNEEAGKWFEFYIQDIDVNNVGDEIIILFQAYLYNVCGNEPEIKGRIREKLDGLLAEIRQNTRDYDADIRVSLLKHISAYVHKTKEEFEKMEDYCKDYKTLIQALESAEKNGDFAKFYNELYVSDDNAPKDLLTRIENVLYDLINTYDEVEKVIIRDMNYNEMILKANGDIAAAQKMYQAKYNEGKPQTLGDLMIRLSLPTVGDDVDIRVKKFAISFLVESIKKAFEAYQQEYRKTATDVHEVVIDSFTIKVDEKEPRKAAEDLKQTYKKNKNKLINKDKGVKAFTGLTVFFCIAFAIMVALVCVPSIGFTPVTTALFALFFLLGVGFIILTIFRRKKVGVLIDMRMQDSLKELDLLLAEIVDWRNKFNAADANLEQLIEALNKYSINKEETGNEF